MRLGLPTPKRYLSVYERKHIETVLELTVGREEIRAPLKTPAWEAIPVYDRLRLRSEAYGRRSDAQVVLVYKLKRTRVKMALYP